MHRLMHWRTTEGWTEKNLRRRVKDRKPEEKEAFFPSIQLNLTGAVHLTATRGRNKFVIFFYLIIKTTTNRGTTNKCAVVRSNINIHVNLELIDYSTFKLVHLLPKWPSVGQSSAEEEQLTDTVYPPPVYRHVGALFY